MTWQQQVAILYDLHPSQLDCCKKEESTLAAARTTTPTSIAAPILSCIKFSFAHSIVVETDHRI